MDSVDNYYRLPEQIVTKSKEPLNIMPYNADNYKLGALKGLFRTVVKRRYGNSAIMCMKMRCNGLMGESQMKCLLDQCRMR